MTAHDILIRASDHILERGKQHDKDASPETGGERNMLRIITVFNELTDHDLSVEDGWTFMAVLKMVRARTSNGFNADHYEDGAAYLALAGEEAANCATVEK